MSLVGNIEKNAEKVRFHTPGQSGMAKNIGTYDITELSYSDNLLHPQGQIAALEQKIASVYKAEACFISTQGATTSLWEAVFATKDDGDFLLVGKIHSSVYNALRAFSLRAYHVDELTEETVLPPSVKTAILTSPDYFGRVLPLEKICARLRKEGIAVVCDSAHGSHFVFSDKLPPMANLFADLTVCSIHKTLPVATGASLLLTSKEWAGKCALARKILHSTSPSYVTICSIEQAFADVKGYKRAYEEVIFHVKQFVRSVKKPFSVETNDDPTRLVLTSPFRGEEVAGVLEEAGFVAEMSYENKVVFIVTPYNYTHLSALSEAVSGLDVARFSTFAMREHSFCEHKQPTALTFGKKWEEIPLEKAVGRKAYVEAGLYPPGVPLVYAGQSFTEDALSVLAAHPNNRFGLNGNKVYVIKE